jgi:hypothetical protein
MRRLRLALASGAALAALACSDGYPTDDEHNVSPFDMTQDERLHAMNLLAREVSVDQRREYRMGADCTLEISRRPQGTQQPSQHVPLKGTDVTVQFDPDAKVYVVGLLARGAKDEPTAVLEAAKWIDAIRMRSLLQSTRRDCHAAAGTPDDPA